MNPGTNTDTSTPTGDPAVDALVDLATQAGQLPAGGHKALYSRVLEGLERELDADPSAALSAAAVSPPPLPGTRAGS